MREMNKKALEDSLFTWIAAFLVIVFIMIIYFLFVLILFGEERLTGDVDIVFEESKIELDLNSKFLSFLSSSIFINGKEEKIIDVIKNSLDPYFEIKNDKGESFVEKVGLNALSEDEKTLNNRMFAFGLNENERNNFLEIGSDYEDNKVKEIIKKLDKICNVDKWDRYFLEVPQGIITKDGLRNKGIFTEEDFFHYTQPIIHKTNYRGENIEIKFRMSRECVDDIN